MPSALEEAMGAQSKKPGWPPVALLAVPLWGLATGGCAVGAADPAASETALELARFANPPLL